MLLRKRHAQPILSPRTVWAGRSDQYKAREFQGYQNTSKFSDPSVATDLAGSSATPNLIAPSKYYHAPTRESRHTSSLIPSPTLHNGGVSDYRSIPRIVPLEMHDSSFGWSVPLAKDLCGAYPNEVTAGIAQQRHRFEFSGAGAARAPR